MGRFKLFDMLKVKYSFRENHILIMEALLNKNYGADNLSKKTGIPKGRIYEFLNFLLKNKIITSLGKHPKVYSINPLSENIANFLELKFSELSENEAAVRAIQMGHKRIIPLNTSESLISNIRWLLVTRKSFKEITSISLPHLFYTNDPDKFEKFTNFFSGKEFTLSPNRVLNKIIRDTLWFAYKNSKEFIYVIDKSSLINYKKTLLELFSKEEIAEILDEIKGVLENKNVEIYISPTTNPYYMLMTETEVILTAISQQSIGGVFIRNKGIVSVYEGMVHEMIEKSDNLLLKWDKVFGNV